MGLNRFLGFFLFLAPALALTDFVPVLIWGNQANHDSKPLISGLSKLDTDDFYNYLLKKVKEDRPNILFFLEENLSVEDFSWKDVNDQGAYPLLNNLTKLSEDVVFLPSVLNPYKALKKFVSQGYTWQKYKDEVAPSLQDDDEPTVLLVQLTEPSSLEDRPDMLRAHDIEISRIYNYVLAYTSNIIGIYSGNQSSWIDADSKFTRVKRNDQEDYTADDGVSDDVILMDNNKTVLILVRSPISFRDGPEFVNLSDTTITPTVEKMKGAIALDVNFKFKNEKPEVDFYFSGSESSDWNLTHVIVNEKKDQILYPSMPIEAPKGYSFYCQKSVMFSDRENQVTLSLQNFQVQPWVRDGKFGPVIDCIPYFSIAIWSGLFVVLILTIVLAWGIVMIMDINTMDRFDDAKGKTITISATD